MAIARAREERTDGADGNPAAQAEVTRARSRLRARVSKNNTEDDGTKKGATTKRDAGGELVLDPAYFQLSDA